MCYLVFTKCPYNGLGMCTTIMSNYAIVVCPSYQPNGICGRNNTMAPIDTDTYKNTHTMLCQYKTCDECLAYNMPDHVFTYHFGLMDNHSYILDIVDGSLTTTDPDHPMMKLLHTELIATNDWKIEFQQLVLKPLVTMCMMQLKEMACGAHMEYPVYLMEKVRVVIPDEIVEAAESHDLPRFRRAIATMLVDNITEDMSHL